jgi:succinyl-diaminopimelate desuccinylase
MMGAMQPASQGIADSGALATRLAERTLQLVDIPSTSRDEAAVLDLLAVEIPRVGWSVEDREDSCLFATTVGSARSPLVVLAGHVDTVPPQGNLPGARVADEILGRGASDMKGALAVMLELADLLAAEPTASDLAIGLLFFGREELPIGESALLPLLERCELARRADLAIVMEPTANAIEIGCLGNLNATVTFRGESAHSARPWLGRNAIHEAVRGLATIADTSERRVEIEGLLYREVVNVTTIEGGIAANVIPHEVRCGVNARYAPTRTPESAEEWLRELLAGTSAEIEVVGNAPPGAVRIDNPLVARLREAGGLDVGPKQAWTPVAEFATVGVDAVNFGPGDPSFAHRADERVQVAALVRSFQLLRGFLAGTRAEQG